MKGTITITFETGLDVAMLDSIVAALRWQLDNAFEIYTLTAKYPEA